VASGLGDLRAAAVALAGADPVALPPSALADQVVELRQLIDGLEGTWSQLVAVLDGSGAAEAGTSAFLRSSCRLAPAASRARVVLARRLAGRPAVEAALTAGEISVDHARVVTNALEELAAADSTLAADAEEPCWRRRGSWTRSASAARSPTPATRSRRRPPPSPTRPGTAAATSTSQPPSTAWSPSTACSPPRGASS